MPVQNSNPKISALLDLATNLLQMLIPRSVIDTKESDGIADPMEKIAIKSHSDHSDSVILSSYRNAIR